MAIKMHTLKCPNCNADLEPIEGKDSMFCPFCGSKVVIEDTNAKTVNINKSETVHVVHTESNETVNRVLGYMEKQNEEAKKNRPLLLAFSLGCFGLIFILGIVGSVLGGRKAKNGEAKLNNLVTEIRQDIVDEDFTSAKIKISQLTVDWTSDADVKNQWAEIRDILQAELDAAEGTTASSSTQETNDGVFGAAIKNLAGKNITNIDFTNDAAERDFGEFSFKYPKDWDVKLNDTGSQPQYILTNSNGTEILIEGGAHNEDTTDLETSINSWGNAFIQTESALGHFEQIYVNEQPGFAADCLRNGAEACFIMFFLDDNTFAAVAIDNPKTYVTNEDWQNYLAILSSITPN